MRALISACHDSSHTWMVYQAVLPCSRWSWLPATLTALPSPWLNLGSVTWSLAPPLENLRIPMNTITLPLSMPPPPLPRRPRRSLMREPAREKPRRRSRRHATPYWHQQGEPTGSDCLPHPSRGPWIHVAFWRRTWTLPWHSVGGKSLALLCEKTVLSENNIQF